MVGPDPRYDQEKAGAGEVLRRLPLAPTLTLSLVGLTVVLAVIAAFGIGNLYGARQDYEDALARTYELESASSRLLAAGVIEEAAFRRRDSGARAARERARDAFDAQARAARALADGDRRSERYVEARIAAERRARGLAGRPGGGRDALDERELAEAIVIGRRANDNLAARQRERREDANDEASTDTRYAVALTAVAGGLALFAAIALIAALIGSIRRPLDQLVGATQRLAAGDLSERVEPSGPQELRELDTAFNTMAERLEGAQSRIEAERAKLAVTIESLGDALIVCDAAGVVTAVNPRAQQIAPALRVGQSTAGPASPLPDLAQALAGEVIVESGERTLSITAARLAPDRGASPDGGGVVWTLRDISERARLDRMKSDFVATASHELRSPLTSIKGFVELLGRSKSLGAREQEFVGVILESTDRLVDLVNDLLDASRLEAGKMEVHPRLFDLSELIREVATMMAARLAEKHQRLDLDLPPGLPRCLADPLRVRQIVINLVSNAHLYTDEGGRLAITLDHVPGGLALGVHDQGRGMTREETERVFDRFVRREDGTSGGTGLGLSIVKSLVELQGGVIEVKSALGVGSSFTVTLPMEPKAQGSQNARAAIRGKRVLVVDDETHVARAIAAQLEPYEVRSEVATNAVNALERLRAGSFDAVTLDLRMNGMGGLDLLRELRRDARLRSIPVVVVSVLSGEPEVAGEWRVNKPADADQLAQALGGAVLAGRTRVLVVGRSGVRPRLEPALVDMGLDHEWVTSATAAASACRERRFEVALVDAGIRDPDAVLRELELRGRRLGQTVVLFRTGDEGEGPARPDAIPIEEAASAVLSALRR